MKTKSVTAGLLTAALLMLLTACGRAGAETAAQTGNAAQIGPEPRTEEAAQTQSQQAPQETEKPESPVESPRIFGPSILPSNCCIKIIRIPK